jgi:hypothetical protein
MSSSVQQTRLAAALVVVLVLGLAGVAQGDDGDALILGQVNEANSATVLDSGGGPDLTFLSGSTALVAEAVEGGTAIDAQTTYSFGVAVKAHNGDGIALDASGRIVTDRSGKLIIEGGHASATHVIPNLDGDPDLFPESLVLAMLQQNRPGVFVRAVVPHPATNSFTVHLNKAVGTNARVAWFVIN